MIYGYRQADLSAVQEFGERVGATDLLVRTDREDETGKYPRGGFLVSLDAVNQLLEDRRDDATRHYFLLEPVHPLEDLYSINSASWPSDDHIIHEIMGPGFDSVDLKRGRESPHERFLVRKRTEIGGLDILDHTIVSPEAFSAGWRRRMVSARETMAQPPLDSEEESIAATRQALRDAGLPFLPSAEAGYQPMGFERLGVVHRSIMRLCSILPDGEFPGEPLALSSAFVGSQQELLHWDIVWPQLKYEGLTR